MSKYHIEIQALVNAALEEMAAEHESGKLVNAPVANNHFLVRWVTKNIKTKVFNKCISSDMIRWQKSGRSKGNQSDLLFTFKRISAFYGKMFPQGDDTKPLKDSDVEAFIDKMDEAGWCVTNTEVLTNGEKIQFFTDGADSFAMCADQCDDSFDGEIMARPMNWFVRGNHAKFIEMAAEAGFMLHKRTDYKSLVKYHGEYIVYPGNHGIELAEIPISVIG
ncbi:alpha-acetolactate decarboxylase [Vibrionales bacterium C3R12]|nr:alpha-acetolactate decarboxylase [Vibrionales bacterium C3R12]